MTFARARSSHLAACKTSVLCSKIGSPSGVGWDRPLNCAGGSQTAWKTAVALGMEENGAASQSVSGSKPSVEANGTSNAAAAPATALTTKIYIGGLPDTTSVDDLRDCFGQLGGVKNIDLKKGFGFVVR